MTNEEMQKAIQFIIEQQAQFAADIQKLTQSQSRLAEATLANTGMIGRLTSIVEKLTEAQTHTDAKMAEMAERLDSFIVVVEKYISEGRNGKSEDQKE
ncbi:MAG TPA: hypothetical protein VLD57_02770 [Blastocatellia bacterium]|nr:hypothetical protein [Blastocatellia bacterium]